MRTDEFRPYWLREDSDEYIEMARDCLTKLDEIAVVEAQQRLAHGASGWMGPGYHLATGTVDSASKTLRKWMDRVSDRPGFKCFLQDTSCLPKAMSFEASMPDEICTLQVWRIGSDLYAFPEADTPPNEGNAEAKTTESSPAAPAESDEIVPEMPPQKGYWCSDEREKYFTAVRYVINHLERPSEPDFERAITSYERVNPPEYATSVLDVEGALAAFRKACDVDHYFHCAAITVLTPSSVALQLHRRPTMRSYQITACIGRGYYCFELKTRYDDGVAPPCGKPTDLGLGTKATQKSESSKANRPQEKKPRWKFW
jgi:hypothetical protein